MKRPNQSLEPTRLRRAVVMSTFDFMKQFSMFAMLALVYFTRRGGPAVAQFRLVRRFDRYEIS
jgi:hypothetical protein